VDSTTRDWVPDTALGKWFLSTDIWFYKILVQATADLKQLAGTNIPGSFDRLMDVGCGQGRMFSLLQKTFSPRQIVGVDIDPEMLKRAAQSARECGCPVDLKLSSVTRLDLPDASIDVIFCHQLIHHVVNQKGALRELHRVLAPGGTLLLAESCEAFIKTWPVRLFFRHPPGVQKPAEGYLDLVRAAGFVFGDADVRTSTPWWSLPDFGLARRLGLVRKPPVATELLLVARKTPA
jgi:SAM-dependent methyltransferase